MASFGSPGSRPRLFTSAELDLLRRLRDDVEADEQEGHHGDDRDEAGAATGEERLGVGCIAAGQAPGTEGHP